MRAFASEPVWQEWQGLTLDYAKLEELFNQPAAPPPAYDPLTTAAALPDEETHEGRAMRASEASELIIDMMRTELQSGERQQTRGQRRLMRYRRKSFTRRNRSGS